MTEDSKTNNAEQAYSMLRDTFYTSLEEVIAQRSDAEITSAAAGCVGTLFDLGGMIFLAMNRIAVAQEELVKIAKLDIESEIKSAAEVAGEQIAKKSQERSFIGRKRD